MQQWVQRLAPSLAPASVSLFAYVETYLARKFLLKALLYSIPTLSLEPTMDVDPLTLCPAITIFAGVELHQRGKFQSPKSIQTFTSRKPIQKLKTYPSLKSS